MTKGAIAGGLALTAVLVLAGCATRPPPMPSTYTVYDCSETLETADGQLVASETSLQWKQDLGDGVTIDATLSLHTPELRERFMAQGFDGADADLPRVVVRHGGRHYMRNYWRDGGPHFEVVSEMRLGGEFSRDWLGYSSTQVLSWSTARAWMAAEPEADFVFTVYDVEGVQLQRAILPGQAFTRIQQTLKALHARAVEKAASRETRCVATTYEEPEEIVIT